MVDSSKHSSPSSAGSGGKRRRLITPHGSDIPLRGALARDRREDDGDPDWPELPDGDGETPPVRPSVPDFAFQIRDLRENPPGCIPQSDLGAVRSAFEAQLQGRFPDADIRAACLQDVGGRAATTIAVWTTSVRRTERTRHGIWGFRT